MKVRLLRGAVAAALAVAVLLPGAATPAHATTGADAVKKVGHVAVRMFFDASSGGLSEAQLRQMIEEFVGAVGDAESVILMHLEALAAAEWVGAAEHAILEVDSIPLLEQGQLRTYALDVAKDARQARSVFRALLFHRSATGDHLGFAITALYPIALAARTAAGLGSTTFMPDYRAAMELLVTKLEPTCPPSPGDLDPHPSIYQVEYTCTTPTGRTLIFQDYQVNGEWREGPWTEAALKAEAGKGTSWESAKAILEQMDSGGL